MFKYEIYFGYKNPMGVYDLLGEVEYGYPLNIGEVIALGGNLFTKLESVAARAKKDNLKYTSAYRVATIHHFLDSPNNLVPSIYIITEDDYEKKIKL